MKPHFNEKSAEASTVADPRDQLWKVAFYTYYQAYYVEMLISALIDRWQIVDETTKVLVALTASGSVVSGWVLWTQPHFRGY